MSIYFDNAAAAPCDPELLSCFSTVAGTFPGNQESMGYHGTLAAARIREKSSELLSSFRFSGITPLFGNSGTEILALAAETACIAAGRGEVITTTLEHPALEFAVRRSCSRHHRQLKLCPADHSGVRLDILKSMLSKQTAVLAVHHVQSETGGILNLADIRSMLDRLAPNALLLVDTMQSIGKIPFDAAAVRPDFFTLSGQKIGAPGGAILFCTDHHLKTARALRTAEHFGGRCPVPVILTLLEGAILSARTQTENHTHALRLKRLLTAALMKNGLQFPQTMPENAASPFIMHLLTAPYQGSILTRALHQYEISVAPGSACESETPDGSRALTAMGYSRKDSFCGLRISFWKENTPEEIQYFSEKFADIVKNY